ncbi:SDR family oxidoreductase [Pelagicoccus sp. SDUM812002]|uniref:SDR family oxidoreductase n=1 Tax=Pelagicoccus sp. SDUM812002 TaxID=3041266 RepID=UPI00280C44E7|nr:SDR family oxidoreductase [Pelagicoccus sp. SDUM812002]MDQ8187861.1 SDR family oxidoreductase [Pelagicoccus sp. SDUM812002]
MKTVAIIGATSAVAQQISLIHVKAGDSVALVGRNQDALGVIAADLKLRGPKECQTFAADLVDSERHDELISRIFDGVGELDCVYIAHGTLPDQSECEIDYEKARLAFDSNCLSHISLLTSLAKRMKAQKHGTIAVITSVAGDRGRKSNYVYGAAKGMLSIYLQGLRNALFEHNVHVLEARPGFIDTPMTAHIEKKGMLWASPQKVATDIVTAASRKKDIIYTPWFWSLIMLIIRSIPEFKFKKMGL